MMFELTVERSFSAAHAIMINGRREPVHGHNWRVRLIVRGEELDSNGLLCDFHVLERELDEVVARFHNRHLNEIPPFDRINPTAELVVKHIADALNSRLPQTVRLHRVRLTEAPGCEATWIANDAER